MVQVRAEQVEQRLPVLIADVDQLASRIADGLDLERGAVAQALLVDVDDLGGSAGKANSEVLVVFAGA